MEVRHLLVVDLRLVVNTYSSARVRTRYRPASLGDPDPLTGRNPVDGVAGVLDGLPEDVRGVFDGGVLEVGVAGKMLVPGSSVVTMSVLLTRPCR